MAKSPNTGDDRGKGGVELKTPTAMGIYRAAINNGYNLTAGQRKAIVREAFCILEDPDSKKRERIAAAKVLLAADKMDLETEKMERGQPGVTNNTQINNTVDLSGLTVEQLKALAGGGE
jgi:hypothetical protein